MDEAELRALQELFTGNVDSISGDAIAMIICVTIICATVLVWKWSDMGER